MDDEIKYYEINGGAVGIVVKIYPDKFYCTYIGDCEAYMVKGNDGIIKLSENHNLYNFKAYSRYFDYVYPLVPK